MSIDIREIRTKSELKRFVRFPFDLYRKDPHWVPPFIKGELETLSPEGNPAFEYCEALYLMAFRNGKALGRIAGIINPRFNESWKNKDARFCWFDVIDDLEVSRALFHHLEKWAAQKGKTRLVGPMGFTTFERQGMLTQGFDEMPTFSGCYNFSYYPEHLRQLGFSTEIQYVEYELKVPEKVPDKIVRISNLIRERYGLRIIEGKSLKQMLPYADPVFRVINAAYKPLYGFTDLTEKQIAYFVKKYFSFLRPDFVSVVLDEEDQVLAFQISVPSLTRALQKARGRMLPFGWYHLMKAMRKPKRLDTMLTGVLPEWQSKGVNAVFMVHLTDAAIRNGIVYAESNGELAENIKVQNIWRYFERRQHRQSQIFGKQING